MILGYYQFSKPTASIIESTEYVEDIVDAGPVYVDIKGEILYTGVYMVDNGTRIFEVIELAGGICENEELDNLDLSKMIEDEEIININDFENKDQNFIYIHFA